MTERPIQYFTDEYLELCGEMSATQVCEFLEDYRHVAAAGYTIPRKAISVRVQVPLLEAFRAKAAAEGVPYQTQIQRLMQAWVDDER